MISEDRVEKALEFIRDKSGELGQWKAAIESSKHRAKVLESESFLSSKGKADTVSEREHLSRIDSSAQEAWQEHHDAIREYHILLTRVKAAELTIEIWRSQNASARKGVV